MLPLRVANLFSLRWWGRLAWISIRPLVPDELVVLLCPHHARECLPLDASKVIGHRHRADTIVEVVRIFSSPLDDIVKFLLVEICLVSL